MEVLSESLNVTTDLKVLAFPAGIEEDSLVTAAKAGHHWAFIELCKRSSPMIHRAIYRIVKCPQDTDDALQDCFMKAFRGLPNFDRRAAFSTWLTRIGINSAFMILRKRAKYREELRSSRVQDGSGGIQELEIADSAPSQEEICIQAELMANLHHAIGRLPASLRCVIELQQSVGASVEEISNHLNISIPAVKSRLLRGRVALRRMLEKQSVA